MEHKEKKLSRRKFLVRGGLGTIGVLAVGTYLARNPIRRKMLDAMNSMEFSYIGETDDPLVWFELTEDNNILLHSPKVEMGQGTFTGLAQLAADELMVGIDQIKVVHATTANGNIDAFSTGGSTSIASLWLPLRELAAVFREMLKAVAANKFGVQPSELSMENGFVVNGTHKTSYAEVAAGVTDWPEVEVPALRPISNYKYVGKPVARVDLQDKVFGTPMFGIDAQLPNMLYAAVVRPSLVAAKMKSVNSEKAASMPGVVKIVEEDDFVGVVARSFTEAENAKNAIEVEWETPKIPTQKELEGLITVGNGNTSIIQKKGSALEEGDIESMEFRSPIGAHAQIEPNGVLASVEGDSVRIIISTQVVAITRDEVADRLGLDAKNVVIEPTFLGGGFGRRLHTPHAVQAAVMSKAVGKPVKYFFSRQEEFQHDMFRPPTHHILKGQLDENGKLSALEHHFVSGDTGNNSVLLPKIVPTIVGADIGSIRGGFLQYDLVPNLRSVYWHVQLPFATSWWRSLGLLANTFAIESFMDHMAIKAGKDPVEFRLSQISDEGIGLRLKNVIKAVAEKVGYNDKPANGRAMGLAASIDAGTPCAHIAEVSIKYNEIKVEKVTVALDPGLSVNPDQVKAQCEGCVNMGISASMFEEMYLEDGSLQPVIYGPYQMAMMKHTPKEIDVILLQGQDHPGPVGEPPLGPIAAAIGNAVFRLTGKRLTRLPLKLA